MSAYIASGWAWVQAHPAECWIAVSAVLNLLLRLKTAEKWVEQLEKTRIGAALVGVVRSLGVDPASALRTLVVMASTKAAASGIGSHGAPPSAGTTMQPPPSTTTTQHDTGDAR